MREKCMTCGEFKQLKHMGFKPDTLDVHCLTCKGALKPLTDYEQFSELIKTFNLGDLTRIYGRSFSIRIPYYIASYLLRYATAKGAKSMNNTIVLAIEKLMEEEPLDDVPLSKVDFGTKEKVKSIPFYEFLKNAEDIPPADTTENLERIVTPPEPEPEPEPEPVPIPEEELTPENPEPEEEEDEEPEDDFVL